MNQPQFTYSDTTAEEVAGFNKELGELGEKHGFVLCPVPYIGKEGKIDAQITILKKVELVPKADGVPSPYNGNDNAGNDSESTEKPDETPEANA